MSVEAACPCGARFSAPPHLYGKDVNCPTCGQMFRVPAPQPQKIAVQCSCGAKYQVAATIAGQRVQCQACKQAFVIGATPAAAPAPDPFGAASAPGFGADPFGAGGLGGAFGVPGGDPLAGMNSSGWPAPGAVPGGMPGYGAGPAAAPFGGAPGFPAPYQTAARPRSGGGSKTVLKVLVIAAIAIIGLAALGGGGWFVYGLVTSGYSTPEAVFAAAVQARRDKDYKKVFSTLTPDSQAQIAGMFVLAGLIGGDREPEFPKALARHGVDIEAVRKKHNLAPGNVLGLLTMNEAKIKELAGEVGDRGAYFADIVQTLEAKRSGGTFPGAGPISFDDGTLPVLKDVVITGDTAVGTQVATIASRPVESKMAFQRVEGRWYLDIGSRLPSRPGFPPPGISPPGFSPPGVPSPGPGR